MGRDASSFTDLILGGGDLPATADLRGMHIIHANIALHKSAQSHYIQDIKRRRR
ncbi:hypothetical protein [Sinorhizobium fredii]|uniref:hypothetical protein n=1 Tax=Rhizobium fredii TaxID=380 RepID=UPI000AD620A5|nr:hypothetical protein [Sinorhizobium fredii]WOS64227.1 hypothetical protein SFGR64A_07590 [Sinorhizobium fredii GR64]